MNKTLAWAAEREQINAMEARMKGIINQGRKRLWVTRIVWICIVLLFLGFIWPTPWAIQQRTIRLSGGQSVDQTIRVHRWSGETQVAGPKGWK